MCAQGRTSLFHLESTTIPVWSKFAECPASERGGRFPISNCPFSLDEAISGVCDYHCEHTVDGSRGDEFASGPFDLYPVEILAIYNIRERLGSEPPKIIIR